MPTICNKISENEAIGGEQINVGFKYYTNVSYFSFKIVLVIWVWIGVNTFIIKEKLSQTFEIL